LDNGHILLTEIGQEILHRNDNELLFETISINILAFDDIVEFIKLSDQVQTEKSVLEYLKENFDVEWSTYNQVTWRLLCLANLGKIKKVRGGYSA